LCLSDSVSILISMIKTEKKAPDFSLFNQDGEKHTLSDYRGKWVVLYFYPKDDTPGCTVEACGMRDSMPRFKKIKAVLFGISPDSVVRHKKFAEKYDLSFALLADEKKEVVKKYGVWQKKKMMGREYMGVVRTSFLIDPKGTIVKIYEKVKPDGHAEEVLADLQILRKE
jgi:thioredoxin-dependent peroxiredoxin